MEHGFEMTDASIKVIITGSSGMVGKGVLLECLDSPIISEVLIVNRTALNITNPKLTEVLISDFLELKSIKQDLIGYDACFFCLGTSSLGKSEEVYNNITYDLTMNFAQSFLAQNDNSVFCYVSGAGTDSTEQGRTMWARVKGKTENALLKMSFKHAYMFRPGYIQPLRGIKSGTNWYSLIYMIFSPVYLILKYFPSSATNTTNIGKAMINAVAKEPELHILNNKEINELAR